MVLGLYRQWNLISLSKTVTNCALGVDINLFPNQLHLRSPEIVFT